MKAAGLLPAALLVAACATPAPEPTDLDRLAALLEGRFDNARQAGLEDGYAHLDARHIRVGVLALSGPVFYSQLDQPDEAEDKRIYRQRLYQLLPAEDAGEVARMRVWSFADAGPFRDAAADNPAFSRLTEADLSPMGDGCDVIWRRTEAGFAGDIDPATCAITSRRSGETLSIGGQFTVDAAAFTHHEEGFRADGSRLFGREDRAPNVYLRQSAP